MKVILRQLGGGKTYQAIKLAKETQSVLVVESYKLAEYLKGRYGLGYTPLTYDNLLEHGSGGRSVVIDDIEAFCLRAVRGRVQIQGVTIDASDAADVIRTNYEISGE